MISYFQYLLAVLLLANTSLGYVSRYGMAKASFGSIEYVTQRSSSSYNNMEGDKGNSNDEDASDIIQALKRELLLFSSITNRGLYTLAEDDGEDELTIIRELVSQLETFQPLIMSSYNVSSETLQQVERLCQGDWDLIMTSSSDAINSFLGLGNLELQDIITHTLMNLTSYIPFSSPTMIQDLTTSLFQSPDGAFLSKLLKPERILHSTHIGRVRQYIRPNQNLTLDIVHRIHIHIPLFSKLLPFLSDKQRIQGISVSTQGTSSSLKYQSGILGWTLKPTQVQIRLLKSNQINSSPDLGNSFLQLLNLLSMTSSSSSSSSSSVDIPLLSTQSLVSPLTFSGVSMETTYVDEEIRICRDDKHFYVWSRA